jgi:hypothetical protein
MAIQDKSPLEWAWFAFSFYNSDGLLTGKWGPVYMNVGAVTLLSLPVLSAQRLAALGASLAGATRVDRAEVWIYETSHEDPSRNVWRIFARSGL